eukprot:NODE_1_length_95616_cov_0.657642.p6 type:complete len:594 gc:universal NODE_1_length_95616_cov_0.657642:46136-44355(-)
MSVMFSLFADQDNSVPSVKMYGYQAYFVEDFVSQQLQIKTVLIVTGNQQDEVILYQYPTNNVPYISSLPNVKIDKTDYGNLYYFEFSDVSFKIVQSAACNLELMQDYVTLQKLSVIEKIPFSIKPLNEATLFKMNHLYKLQLSVSNYRMYFDLILLILSTSIRIFGISIPSCSFFSNSLFNSFQSCILLFSDESVMHCTPKWFVLLVSQVLSYKNKLNFILKGSIKDPFSDPQSFFKSISIYQKGKDLKRTGFLDSKTMSLVDISYQKHRNRHIPNKIKSKLEDLSGIQHRVLYNKLESIDELLEYQLGEKLGLLWGKDEKQQEGLLRGGKEFGKTLIKNVHAKTLIPDTDRVLSLSYPLNPLVKKRKSSGKSASDQPNLVSPESVPKPLVITSSINNGTINHTNLVHRKAKSTDNLIKHSKALRRTFSTTDIGVLLNSGKERMQLSEGLLIEELNDLFSTLNHQQSLLESNIEVLNHLEKDLALEKEELTKKCALKKSNIEYYEKIVNGLLGVQSKIMINNEDNSKKLKQTRLGIQQFESQLSKVQETVQILADKISENNETEQILIKSSKHNSLLTGIINWVKQLYFKKEE